MSRQTKKFFKTLPEFFKVLTKSNLREKQYNNLGE